MAQRSENILVLYATQMGNSRRAAQAFCDEMATKLSASAIQDMTGTDQEVAVTPVMVTLDDFLKEKQGAWTRLAVIFVSSYGMGDAPKGGTRFRDMCEMLEMSPKKKGLLTGLQFAICGLGNSSFRTFMENPNITEETLTAAGARRVGEFGKADADKKGDDCQKNVIIKWQEGIWKPLALALIEEPLSEERLGEMQCMTNSLKY